VTTVFWLQRRVVRRQSDVSKENITYIFRVEELIKQEANLLLPVSCFACSSTLNMEAICSPETPGSLWITWRYNPENRNLQFPVI
jgi:hypothetical protein